MDEFRRATTEVAARDGAVSFLVLGPLTVLQGGAAVAAGGPKERLVLAHLVARANHVVPIDALVEAVWADRPPRSAERTLQAYVARLRGILEPDRPSGVESTMLVRTGAGYRLDVESWQVDALRFEELAARGSHQLHDGDRAALVTLREAMALWRGDAFGEFRAIEACDSEARRLEELRLVAVEDRLDAELAAGAASEVVAELESLVSQHEFRERLWGQLMLALYRSGRQRDALAAIAGPGRCSSSRWGSSRAVSCGRSRRRSSSKTQRSIWPARCGPVRAAGAAGVGRTGVRRARRRAGLAADGMARRRRRARRLRVGARAGGDGQDPPAGRVGQGGAAIREASCCTPAAASPAPASVRCCDRRSATPGRRWTTRWRAADGAGPGGDADAGHASRGAARCCWPSTTSTSPTATRSRCLPTWPAWSGSRVAARGGDVPDRRRRT